MGMFSLVRFENAKCNYWNFFFFSILSFINAGSGDKFLGFKIRITHINKQNPNNNAEGVIKEERQE
jgi:hypothetical protein